MSDRPAPRTLHKADHLLLAVQRREDGAEQAFDECLYPLLVEYVRKKSTFLKADAARALGLDSLAAPRPVRLDELACDVANTTLRRVRAKAEKFDPDKGTAMGWILRSCSLAYVDELRAQVGGRGQLTMVPTDPTELFDADSRTSPDPARQAVAADELRRALAELTPEERNVIVEVKVHGRGHAEAADVLYPQLEPSVRVTHLQATLKRAVRRLTDHHDQCATQAAADLAG